MRCGIDGDHGTAIGWVSIDNVLTSVCQLCWANAPQLDIERHTFRSSRSS